LPDRPWPPPDGQCQCPEKLHHEETMNFRELPYHRDTETQREPTYAFSGVPMVALLCVPLCLCASVVRQFLAVPGLLVVKLVLVAD
jgi:hypothetical protein